MRRSMLIGVLVAVSLAGACTHQSGGGTGGSATSTGSGGATSTGSGGATSTGSGGATSTSSAGGGGATSTSGTGGSTTSSGAGGGGGGPACTAQDAATACDDQNPCSIDTCDTLNGGVCVHTPATDGAACNGSGTCGGGACIVKGGPWSRGAGCSMGSEGDAVVVDAAGNVTVAGYFTGSMDLGLGTIPTITSLGGKDAFVAHYDPAGKPLWIRVFGGPGDQRAVSLALTPGGSIFVTGSFAGSADFGAGMVASAGGDDAFLARLDAAGNTVWAKRFGDASDQHGTSVAVDAAGDVVLAGDFLGTADFGAGVLTSPGIGTLASSIFLAKLTPAGSAIWSKAFVEPTGHRQSLVGGVAVDPADNIVLAGTTNGQVDFGGGPLALAGGSVPFVARFQASGAHQWSESFYSNSGSTVTAVAVDGAGAVAIAGGFNSQLIFPGTTTLSNTNLFTPIAFVAKLTLFGVPVFSHAWGEGGGDPGKPTVARALLFDPAGNLLVAGAATGVVDLGGGPVSYPSGAAFLNKLDPMGGHLQTRIWGAALPLAVALSASGDPVLAGSNFATLDFGTGLLLTCGQDTAFVADLIPGAPATGGCATNADCSPGQACLTGHCLCQGTGCQPVKLAHFPQNPAGIAVDAAEVYVTTNGGGLVMKVSIDGGNPYLLASQQAYPDALTADAGTLYWLNFNNGVAGGAVMSLPKAGGAPTAVAPNQIGPAELAVDATNIYWITSNGDVLQAPKGGGAPTTLASGQYGAGGIAVDATSVYWAAKSLGKVMKTPIGGGTQTVLASGLQGPSGLALDASAVYWTDTVAGTIMKLPLGGGTPVTLVSGLQNPVSIKVDGASVYWANRGDNSVRKAPIGGGAAVTLASGQSAPFRLALDANAVYWTNFGDGTLMKVPK